MELKKGSIPFYFAMAIAWMFILLTSAQPVEAKLSCRRVFYSYHHFFHKEYFRSIPLPRSGFILHKNSLTHILSGELSANADGKIGLHGGMHTEYAFHRFLNQRDELAQLFDRKAYHEQLLPNGVRLVVIPREMYSDPTNIRAIHLRFEDHHFQGGLKSLFPGSWDPAKILHAIDAVITDYYRLSEKEKERKTVSSNQGFLRIRGVYEGVAIAVSLIAHKRQVITAFPMMRQPVPKTDFKILSN